MLKDLLKKYLNDDDKVIQFLDEMKASKIYTSNEENIDRRYAKLQGDYTTKETELADALKQIETFKQANADVTAVNAKLAEAQNEIARLNGVNKQLAQENELKVTLLSSKAKADDIDYLLFKLSKDENAVKYDDNGKITNGKEIVESLKKTYPSHFEDGSKRQVDVKQLPDDDNNSPTITKERFDKMGYHEKNKLYNENKELYDKLNKGEE